MVAQYKISIENYIPNDMDENAVTELTHQMNAYLDRVNQIRDRIIVPNSDQ